MTERHAEQPRKDFFPRVSEGSMSDVVSESDRLGQIGIQAQPRRDGTRDLRDLQSVRQTRPVMISLGRDKDLRLMLQATERFAVYDTISVPLKLRAERTGIDGDFASARVTRQGSVFG